MPDETKEGPVHTGLKAVFDVVHRLRAPGGCPWDREQTHRSLRPYLLEETYELLEAIDSGDDEKMREELGDVLLQVAMHTEIAAEEGRFDAEKVSEAVAAKMVSRHPHVFGDTEVADAEEVLRNWERRKAAESAAGGSRQSVLDRVPQALPALAWTLALQKRAARIGFDLETSPTGAEGRVAEEDHDLAFEQLGDLLFGIVNLARRLKLNPEDALRASGQRFKQRFHRLEADLAAGGTSLWNSDPEDLQARWRSSES